MTSEAKRKRHRAHTRANRLREAKRKGTLSHADAAWLKAYDDVVLPGRPRKGVDPAPIPPRPALHSTALVRIHHLDEVPPPREPPPPPSPEPDARTPPLDGAPLPKSEPTAEPLKGVVICKVCGRPLPCPVHPPGAKPTAPPIDLPDPTVQTSSDEKQKHRGPGFKGRMGGLVAMGARLLKGVGEELRAAGKWYAWDDEMVDEFWKPHAEETTAELASAVQDTVGISDEAVSGIITFGGLGAGILAKQMLDEEQKKKGSAEVPRAAAPHRPSEVHSTATEAKPEPPPAAPPNGANGATARERPRVQLEPEMPSVDDH